jgi:hypothetical protein
VKYKFASYTSNYGHPNELRRTLSSLSDKVDLMIVHQGRYLGYDDEERLSQDDDEAFKIASSYDCHIVVSSPSTELEKRQLTPTIAKELNIDFMIILDSDEYIDVNETDWEKFVQKCIEIAIDKYHGQYNLFGIKVEDGPQNYRYLPRLWYRPEDIYYDSTHYGLKSKNPRCPFNCMEYNKLEKHPSIENIPFLTIRSNYDLRTDYEKVSREHYGYVINNQDTHGLFIKGK